MEKMGVINLTIYDLGNSENYSAAKDIFVGVAQQRAFWQNPANRLDVSGDGRITPIEDVLRPINELNGRSLIDSDHRLPLPMPLHRSSSFFDVSGDGFLTPVHDVLPVINFLNEQARAGEGESSSSNDEQQYDQVFMTWMEEDAAGHHVMPTHEPMHQRRARPMEVPHRAEMPSVDMDRPRARMPFGLLDHERCHDGIDPRTVDAFDEALLDYVERS
jgi:hypothetical protein